jgi:Protein of unknown function (DUF2752)
MTAQVAVRRVPFLAPLGCVLVALGYLAVADPHDPHAVMPPCPTKLLTGWDCPLCGGLRVVHDVLHGELGAALHDNVFLLLISPFSGWLGWRRFRRPGQAEPRSLVVAISCVAAGWMVARNLPWWPWKPTLLM